MFHSLRSAPSAKVTDGRLVLSLPDAETPALWIMDLNDAATSVLRLENDRNGLYVIKKHGGGKNASETVAVYRDRKAAACAMNRAGKALEKARDTRNLLGGRPVIVRPSSRMARFFTIVLFVWFILYLMGLDQLIIRMIFDPLLSVPVASGDALTGDLSGQIPPSAPDAAAAPPGISPSGVPLSADDFLNNQISGGMQ